MRTDTLRPDAVPGMALPRPDRRLIVRLFRGAMERFLLLPLGAAIAVVWANLDPEPYFRFSHAVAFPVNEIAMAFFLALIAQELFEALMPRGTLSHWHHWGASVTAAAGGLAGSAAGFWLFIGAQHQLALGAGWPVAAAVDVAAGYYVMRLIYPYRHSATTFVLLAAVVTDLVAMTIVTIQSPEFTLGPGSLAVLLAALGVAAWLRRRKVRSFWPYWLGSGTLSWFAFYTMGIHPALALIPVVPFLPHDARRGEVFADRPDNQPIHHGEHEWNVFAQIALFLFGLVNAGVILKHFDTGSWAVLVAALLGRPAGIVVATALAISVGMRLPGHMRWADLLVAALATSCGFTFAMVLASATLPIGAVNQQITLGALATVSGAGLTIGAARLLAAGRFKPHGLRKR